MDEVKSLGFTTKKTEEINPLNNLLIKKTETSLRKVGIDPEITPSIKDINNAFESKILPVKNDIVNKLDIINSANSILTKTETALNSINNSLLKIQNDLNDFSNNKLTQTELIEKSKNIVIDIQKVVDSANFNGNNLLDGSFKANFYVPTTLEDNTKAIKQIEIDLTKNNPKINSNNEVIINPNLNSDLMRSSQKIYETLENQKQIDPLVIIEQDIKKKLINEKLNKTVNQDQINQFELSNNITNVPEVFNNKLLEVNKLKKNQNENKVKISDSLNQNIIPVNNSTNLDKNNSKNSNDKNNIVEIKQQNKSDNALNVDSFVKKIKNLSEEDKKLKISKFLDDASKLINDNVNQNQKKIIAEEFKTKQNEILKNTKSRIENFLNNNTKNSISQPIINKIDAFNYQLQTSNNSFAGVKGLNLNEFLLNDSFNQGIFAPSYLSLTLQSINYAINNVKDFLKYIKDVKMQVSSLENSTIQSLNINNTLFPKVENIDFANRYLDTVKEKLKKQTQIVSFAQANETPSAFINFMNKNDLSFTNSFMINDKNDISLNKGISNANTISSNKLSVYEKQEKSNIQSNLFIDNITKNK